MRRSQRIAEHAAAEKKDEDSESFSSGAGGRTKVSTYKIKSSSTTVKKTEVRSAKSRRTDSATGDTKVQRHHASRQVSKGPLSRDGQSAEDRETVNTSPIQDLPPELISEIFLRLFDLFMGSDVRNPIPKFVKAVSFVCSKWRKIAYGTPQLWTYLRPPGRRGWPIDINKIDAYLEHYLPLSRGRPLHLRLQCPHETILQQLAPRLQELRLVYIDFSFERVKPIKTPLLETALLAMSNLSTNARASLAFLQDAPRLTILNVIIQGASPDCELTLPPTARIEVLHLEIDSASFAALLPPLRQCRATLRKLTLMVCKTSQLGTVINPFVAPIELPALKHLVLQRDAHGLLHFITVPALELLSFSAQWGDVGQILLAYLERVKLATMLTSLHIGKVSIYSSDDERIQRCFLYTPNLEKLRIGQGARRALKFLQLPYAAGEPIYLPKLNLLAAEVDMVWELDFVEKGFLRSRMAPTVAFGTPVSAVRVVSYDEGGKGVTGPPARDMLDEFDEFDDSDTALLKRDVSSWLATCRTAKAFGM